MSNENRMHLFVAAVFLASVLLAYFLSGCSGTEKPAAPPRDQTSVLSCEQQVMLEAGCWGSGQPDENGVFCADPEYQEVVRVKIEDRCL